MGIITTFGKMSVGEVIEIAGRGSSGSLQRPQHTAFMAVDGREVPT